jgi:hypothetical protein
VAFWRCAQAAVALGVGWLTLVTFVKAMRGAWDSRDFPEMLAVKVMDWPTVFSVHMVSGGLALLLVPAAIALAHTRGHKIVAPVAALTVLVAAATSVPVAWASPLTRWTALGFTTQALVWVALLGLGLLAAFRGDVRRHRACMLLMAAVTSGAMLFRVYLALWVAFAGYAHFKTFYSCDAFFGWLTPLAGMALWLRFGARVKCAGSPAARAGCAQSP